MLHPKRVLLTGERGVTLAAGLGYLEKRRGYRESAQPGCKEQVASTRKD